LAALVAVVDDVLGTTLADRHLQRVKHQLGAQVVCHRPAHDLAAEGIEYDGEIQEPHARRNVGDIGNPQPVRAGCRKVAADQVGGWSCLFVASRGRGAATAMAGTNQPCLTHQARNPLAAMGSTACPQFGMNARCAIGLAGAGMYGAHALQ
jgi:hypothetical protein